ncbi:unnamed protein product [Musa textilis]
MCVFHSYDLIDVLVEFYLLESQMRTEIDELDATIRELQDQNSSFQEKLVNEETEKLVAIKSYENERETRDAAENSRDTLSLDLQRVNQENKCFSDQVPYSWV